MIPTKHLQSKNLQKKFSAIDSFVEANNKRYTYKKKTAKPNNTPAKKWGANEISDSEITLMKSYLAVLKHSNWGLNRIEREVLEKETKKIENNITQMQVDKLLGVKGPITSLADTTSTSTNNRYGFTLEQCRGNTIGKVFVRKIKDMCIDNHLSKNQIKKLFPEKNMSEELIYQQWMQNVKNHDKKL